MKVPEEAQERTKELRRFEAEQSNAALAARLKRNSNCDPLWDSGPRPPLIWRIGAGILGIFFLLFGVGFFCLGLEDHSVALFVAAILAALVSARPLWNAFKPRKAHPAAREDSPREP